MPQVNGGRNNFAANVDESERLWVRAVSVEEAVRQNQDELAFNINTGLFTLTDDAETPLKYVKNNETRNLIIETIVVGYFDTNGTSSNKAYTTVIKNPTAGTIIDTPVAVDVNSNRNYGATQSSLTADAYKGATGKTLTDGETHILALTSLGSRYVLPINEIIPKNKTIGVKLNPNTSSNTSLQVYCAFICYLRNTGE